MTSTRNARPLSVAGPVSVGRCQQAVGACMRKLVMICYGILKNRQPFDPDWASKITR